MAASPVTTRISSHTRHTPTVTTWLLTTTLLLVAVPPASPDHSTPAPPEDHAIPTVLPERCLEGPHHKATPSRESDAFLECRAWRDASCCTVNVSTEIHRHRAKTLYGYHWDLCGDLSPDCEQMLKWEECFYQCEPTLVYYVHPEKHAVIRDVPICGRFCERWFQACKHDLTCVEDWLSDFHWDKGENICPRNSSCVTFEEMYGDARGMCDRMWGEAFVYHPDDRDCLVMEFDPERGNPNTARHASSDASSGSPAGLIMGRLIMAGLIMAGLLRLASPWHG